MAWPRAMPIVLVDWVDSHQYGGWNQSGDWDERFKEDGGSLACRSVGYLYRRDKHSLVLMQSQAETGAMADAIRIPRRAVVSMRTLVSAKEQKEARKDAPE